MAVVAPPLSATLTPHAARFVTGFPPRKLGPPVSSVDVSVVLCAHDEGRWKHIVAALASLQRQSVPVREVVIVVDYNDQLLERIQRELDVRAVPNTGLKGLHGARNTGIQATSGAVLAYMDDDAIASPDLIALLSEPYSDPLVAGVGGSAQPAWETERPAWFPPEFDWAIGCSYLGMPTTVREVRNLFGCNMSFRRETLEELGGFRIGYSCDETELCIRLHQRWPDKKLVYVPEARICHYVPADRTEVRRFLWRCYFEGGSKAVVSRLVGSDQGLASERDYTRHVLPAGLRRGLGEFVSQRSQAGLGQAAAIAGGLLSTVAGYASAQLMFGRAARRRGWDGEFKSRRRRTPSV
jgi:glycosyltransferase involved in cell wall biosynthesis